MKKICIVSMCLVEKDGRVQRQIDAISREFELDLYAPLHDEAFINRYANTGINIHQIPLQTFSSVLLLFIFVVLKMKKFSYKHYPGASSLIKQLKATNKTFDCLIVNDIYQVPAVICAQNEMNGKLYKRLVIDAHEYYLDDGIVSFMSKYVNIYTKWACDYSIPQADFFITVSQEILDLYKSKYKIKQSLIVYNTPNKTIFNDTHLFDKNNVIVENHGGAQRRRKLETTIEAMKYLDEKYQLKMYLTGDKEYENELREYINKEGVASQVTIEKPVKPSEIAATMAKYDIGICYMPNLSTNHEYSMPNKLFESIAAGNPVIVTPNTSMRNFVEKYSIGVVADGYEAKDVAKAIKLCVKNYDSYKKSVMNVKDAFTYERIIQPLISYIKDDK